MFDLIKVNNYFNALKLISTSDSKINNIRYIIEILETIDGDFEGPIIDNPSVLFSIGKPHKNNIVFIIETIHTDRIVKIYKSTDNEMYISPSEIFIEIEYGETQSVIREKLYKLVEFYNE